MTSPDAPPKTKGESLVRTLRGLILVHAANIREAAYTDDPKEAQRRLFSAGEQVREMMDLCDLLMEHIHMIEAAANDDEA